jgi:hypothetical protein
MPTFTVQAVNGTRGATVTDQIAGVQQTEIWVQNGSAASVQVVGGNDGRGRIHLVTRPDATSVSTIQLDNYAVSDGETIDLN